MESFVASDFWTELSNTVSGLKSVLELDYTDEHAKDVVDESNALTEVITDVPNPDTIIFGSNILLVNDESLITPALKSHLLIIYKQRVDTIFKPLHWPSALRAVRSQQLIPSTNTKALESAIYFTATCSLLDHELDNKAIIVEACQWKAERALIEAGLLTNTSMMVLQAFVIYLVSHITRDSQFLDSVLNL